jgi:hypothetical protein
MDPRDHVPAPLWLILSILFACAVMIGQAATDDRQVVPVIVHTAAAAPAPSCITPAPDASAHGTAPGPPADAAPGPVPEDEGDPWSIDPPSGPPAWPDVVEPNRSIVLAGHDLVRTGHRQ